MTELDNLKKIGVQITEVANLSNALKDSKSGSFLSMPRIGGWENDAIITVKVYGDNIRNVGVINNLEFQVIDHVRRMAYRRYISELNIGFFLSLVFCAIGCMPFQFNTLMDHGISGVPWVLFGSSVGVVILQTLNYKAKLNLDELKEVLLNSFSPLFSSFLSSMILACALSLLFALGILKIQVLQLDMSLFWSGDDFNKRIVSGIVLGLFASLSGEPVREMLSGVFANKNTAKHPTA